MIDLRGRTVVPGLIDTHLHGLDTADRPGYHALDVESATSIREVQDVLAAHRKTVPEGQWITRSARRTRTCGSSIASRR